MIYLIANTKGGVGKTTIAVHLAAWLAKKGKCLLIDADKQASAASWSSWRKDLDLKHNPRTMILLDDSVYKEGREFVREYDNTVIDAGGRDDPGMRYAMVLADKLIVPMSHSDLDTSAWSDMQKIIEMSKPSNPNLEVHVLLSRIDPRRRPPKDIYEFMAEQKTAIFKTIITERVIYVNSTNKGMTVFETEPDSPAAKDMKALFKELSHPIFLG
ncbi:MAG: ParA family protein [Sulfuricella sp.]|nr:ParA family protein [Sulfuricella sp.]